MRNGEVAEVLYEIADFLDLKGVEWKPRAYRRAAQAIETLPEDIQEVYDRGELRKIPGVGESIASKVGEYLETGSVEYLEELREELPEGLRDLMEIEGIGPKTAQKLYKTLHISSIDELESAAEGHRIRGLEGFGERTEEEILEGIRRYRGKQDRFLLGYVLPTAEQIVGRLKGLGSIEEVSLAGSIRRRKETVGDVDVLAVSGEPPKVMDFFTAMPEVGRVVSKGERKSTVVLTNNLQVDLMIIEGEDFGSALQYFTGSKPHNIALRELALKRGWKLSEYGLIEKSSGKKIAGEKEEGVYEALGLSYIEPELREDRGEIEAAAEGKLPNLLGYGDVRGDLHTHSTWSEGTNSIMEMAEAARSLGHEYMAMCDHSKTLPIARGLDEEAFRKREKEIEDVNRELEGFTVLSGAEVNIDSGGKLDLDDDLLKDLDFVVASIHSGFKQPEEKITGRIVSAMHDDNVDAIGHPTGRLIQKRPPYDVNLDEVFEAASELGVLMEINAFPTRLDLSDANILKARDYKIRFSIGTDAHSRDHLRYMELGVATARRGWLEKKDVVNTLPLKGLRRVLER